MGLYRVSRGAILFGAALVCALLALTDFFPRQSEQAMNTLFALRGARPVRSDIIIVGIDEDSIRELGSWPFPRREYLTLFNKLREAKVVGFDLIFAEGSKEMDLFTAEGVPIVVAAAFGYRDELLAPDLSGNPWIVAGHVETGLGVDGIVRNVELVERGLPAFALAVKGAGTVEAKPVGRRLINFYGPEFTFPYLSFRDVLRGKYPPEFFADRYVLVGAKALGLGDTQLTPFSIGYPFPGVEIQATILNNLLDSSFLRTIPRYWQILFAFSLLVLLVFLFPRHSLGKNLLLVCGVLLLLAVLSCLLFWQNFFFDPFLPSFMAFVGYLLHIAVEWMLVSREVLAEIKELNRKLKESARTFFHTVPYLQDVSMAGGDEQSDKPRFGGLDQHLRALRRGIRTLSMQNSFVQYLMNVETVPLIIWTRDCGQVVVANSGFSSLWKSLDISDDLPDMHSFFRLLEESRLEKKYDDRKMIPASFDRDYFREEIVCDIVLRVKGVRLYLRVIAHEVEDAASGFKGVIASIIDVTGIRELEQRKGEVMHIISHELKLPLTEIMGYGDLLADTLTGEKKGYAEKVSDSARRLSGMITDFLDIARIESGKNMISRLPFDLIDVVNDAVAVAAAVDVKGITIDTQLPAKVSPIVGDGALMTQVIINLLDNAMKFSPAGSIVCLELVEQETEFHLFVTDAGKGVADGDKEKIFKKFCRGADESEGTGFGLGLNFVLQVVTGHGGSVSVGDADGGGAVFHLVLPRRRE